MDIPLDVLKQKMIMRRDRPKRKKLLPHQPALDLDAQIENLKQINLIVPDERAAKRELNSVSYFRLVKAYGANLKPQNGNYDGTTTFDDLVDLYDFNTEFRQLLIAQIERVEVALRCRIGNYFSVKYGVLGYERASNFNSRHDHKIFLADAYETIARNSRSPFIRNFQARYEQQSVPMYALVEILSFGALSKLFKGMQNADKKAIGQIYGHNWVYLESWFEALAYVRNICAHYGRLYDIRLGKTPKFSKKDRAESFESASTIRVFSTVFCLKKLVAHDAEWQKFVSDLANLFVKHPKAELDKIGFPRNWQEILLR